MTAEEQKQFDDMKKEKERLEQQNKALKGDSNALKREKADLIKECSAAYREFRGDNYTARDGVDYEETLEKLDLHELRVQKDILAPEGSEEGSEGDEGTKNVQAGDKTRQPNKSRLEDTEGSDTMPMPAWFNRGTPVKVIQQN